MTLNSLASNAENEARRAASLRRIAIVLRDLPDAVAKHLLASLGTEARQRVQREVRTLVDVDPMERKRALESFTGSLKRQTARNQDARHGDADFQNQGTHFQGPHFQGQGAGPSGDPDTPQDELSFSASGRMASNPQGVRASTSGHAQLPGSNTSLGNSPEQDNTSTQLRFLDQLADEDLLSLMKEEHPQTKAVVFASIEPARAAHILPRLGNAERQDMLSRIGRLKTLPDEMISDLASSFQSRVESMHAARNRNPLQQLIDQNAIDHPGDPPTWNPAEAAKHVPASAVAVSPRLQAILAEMPSSSAASTHTNANAQHVHEGIASPNRAGSENHHHSAPRSDTQEEAANTAAERLRMITRETTLSNHSGANHAAANHSMSHGEPQRSHESNPQGSAVDSLSTDAIHQQLLQLPPKRLCEALGRVETRIAILALCGLPNKTADAAIACLPRAAANQVRQHLLSIGSMEIREIDQAKVEVAKAAMISDTIGGSSATVADTNPTQISHSAPATQRVAA